MPWTRLRMKQPVKTLLPGGIMAEVTWVALAGLHPAFVQWVVQRHGPLPEGEVSQVDYERFKAEYEAREA